MLLLTVVMASATYLDRCASSFHFLAPSVALGLEAAVLAKTMVIFCFLTPLFPSGLDAAVVKLTANPVVPSSAESCVSLFRFLTLAAGESVVILSVDAVASAES